MNYRQFGMSGGVHPGVHTMCTILIIGVNFSPGSTVLKLFKDMCTNWVEYSAIFFLLNHTRLIYIFRQFWNRESPVLQSNKYGEQSSLTDSSSWFPLSFFKNDPFLTRVVEFILITIPLLTAHPQPGTSRVPRFAHLIRWHTSIDQSIMGRYSGTNMASLRKEG